MRSDPRKPVRRQKKELPFVEIVLRAPQVDQEEYQRAFAPSRAGNNARGTAGDAETPGTHRTRPALGASALRGKAHLRLREPGATFTGRKSTLELIVFSPSMQGEKKERWERLCEQASTEQDPVKMLKLITEINELLMAKETRLLKAHPPAEPKNP